MKKLTFLASILLLMAFAPIKDAPPIENISSSCNTINTVFNPNEKIDYLVYYNWNFVWVKAGWVNFSTKETTYAGQPSYLLRANGQTLKSYDPFYKVRNKYYSYVEKDTLRPLKNVTDLDEGGTTRYEEHRFNHASNTIAHKRGKTKETIDETNSFKFDNCTFDIVTIMYYLRNLDLDKYSAGDKIPVKIFMGRTEYDLYVKYLGIDTVKVKKQGKFKCHKLSPLLVAGKVFTDTNKMTVWVTADDNQIPVMVESPLRVGKIKAVIAGTENLKYVVDAKL